MNLNVNLDKNLSPKFNKKRLLNAFFNKSTLSPQLTPNKEEDATSMVCNVSKRYTQLKSTPIQIKPLSISKAKSKINKNNSSKKSSKISVLKNAISQNKNGNDNCIEPSKTSIISNLKIKESSSMDILIPTSKFSIYKDFLSDSQSSNSKIQPVEMEDAYKLNPQNQKENFPLDNSEKVILLEAQIKILETKLEEQKQNYANKFKEIYKTMEDEKVAIRKQYELEKITAVEETKKKKWCIFCGKLANYYIWRRNRYYCGNLCQSNYLNQQKQLIKSKATQISPLNSLNINANKDQLSNTVNLKKTFNISSVPKLLETDAPKPIVYKAFESQPMKIQPLKNNSNNKNMKIQPLRNSTNVAPKLNAKIAKVSSSINTQPASVSTDIDDQENSQPLDENLPSSNHSQQIHFSSVPDSNINGLINYFNQPNGVINAYDSTTNYQVITPYIITSPFLYQPVQAQHSISQVMILRFNIPAETLNYPQPITAQVLSNGSVVLMNPAYQLQSTEYNSLTSGSI